MNEAIITNHKRTADGKLLIGKENNNPLFDTTIYKVEFPNGGRAEYATNIIAESIYNATNMDHNTNC